MKTLALILVLSAVMSGAIYKGENIDGKPFQASLKGDGKIVPVQVTFDGQVCRCS